jgi:hypothetical protein
MNICSKDLSNHEKIFKNNMKLEGQNRNLSQRQEKLIDKAQFFFLR